MAAGFAVTAPLWLGKGNGKGDAYFSANGSTGFETIGIEYAEVYH
jgi:hypothetical protein